MTRSTFFSMIAGLFGAGAARAQQWKEPALGCTTIWCSDRKPALNGQCPVCGTMAEPYDRKALVPKGAMAADGVCFVGTLATGIQHVPCSIDDVPVSRSVRCKRCNAAFWQDAEK